MKHLGWAACLAACLGAAAACRLAAGSDTPGSSGAPRVRGVAGGVQAPVALELRHPGGSERLEIAGDGPFAFEAKLAPGTSYTVALAGEPPCLLDGAEGVLGAAGAELGLACNGAATLAELGLSGPTALELELTPGQLAYTAAAPLLQQRVSLTPVARDAGTTITIAGQPVASGTPSAPIPLALGDNQIEVVVSHPSGLQRTYAVTVRRADALAQYAYAKASNTGRNDRFGYSVALSGDTLAVGARNEASAAQGVGGNQDDDRAPGSGAVYVFRRSGTTWAQEAYLKPEDSKMGNWFGASVALSGDTLAVGANGRAPRGAVYVFRRSGTTWTEEARLGPSNESVSGGFGMSVALDGDTLAVGAPHEASAATGVNGDQNAKGAPASGAVYVFRRSGTTWAQEAYVKASNTGARDSFGTSVALGGDTLAVGAPYEASAATGVNGNQDDDSAEMSGAAYVFRRDGATWAQKAYLKASNTHERAGFGTSVALSGDTLAVGAPSEGSPDTSTGVDPSDGRAFFSGAVYVFRRGGATWAQEAYLKPSNLVTSDEFGASVALAGDTLAVGAPDENSAATGVGGKQDDDGAADSGAVYVFRRDGTAWAQESYVKASNTGEHDGFGGRVALSHDTLAVGTPDEDSAAAGVGGNQDDDSAKDSGAVYLFH